MSTENSNDMKKVILKSSDKREFEVSLTVAEQAQTIKHLIDDLIDDDDCASRPIPLPNVTGNTLALVVAYAEKHASASASDEDNADLKQWDTEFAKGLDHAVLHDLILAANYLSIKSLLDLTCQTVADMINGKTPEQIRNLFEIENDFTQDEEERMRRQHQWAFE